MAWIYLADMEASPMPYQTTSDLSFTVKSTDTLKEFYYQGCQKEGFQLDLSGMTSRPCQEANSKHMSILSTVDSPVRISALLDMEKEWKASEADFSLNCVAWSKKSSPVSSSWKTYQPLELEVYERLSEPLPISGMTAGGLVYQPLKLELRTLEKDGSYWHTPRATEISESYETYLKRMQSKSDPKSNTKTKPGDLLMQVRMMQGQTGRLNPTWVEWLMGVPLGWTELKPWAMEWCRSKSKRRSKD